MPGHSLSCSVFIEVLMIRGSMKLCPKCENNSQYCVKFYCIKDYKVSIDPQYRPRALSGKLSSPYTISILNQNNVIEIYLMEHSNGKEQLKVVFTGD